MADTATKAGRAAPGGESTSPVQDAASTVQEKAGELKEQGKNQLGQTLDRRTTETGAQARKMAQALRESGERMRSEGDGGQVAGVADTAADRIERFGGYLERTSGDELLRDVESFARRRPWMVAGIGLVAGLAASRFLKASSERRYGSSQQFRSYSEANDYYGTPRITDGGYADEPIARESYGANG